jgi:hypothetical protein
LLRINNSNVEYFDPTGTLRWSVPIDSIILIAEYTTNEGPWADDYFLVFVTLENQQLYFSTCPYSADGIIKAPEGLKKHLGVLVQLDLVSSTDWRSRVAWPVEMAGTEYFTFTEVPPKNLAQKLQNKLLGPPQEYRLSKAVQEYLRQQLRSGEA